MPERLLKLFNVRAPEWPRVSLLFTIAFLVSLVGLWGVTTAYAAFLKQTGVGILPLVLLVSAILSILASAVYSAFVDRIPNDLLLMALFVVYAIGIAVGLVLLVAGLSVIAFPLLYLLDAAWTVVFTMHFATFVNGSYDIQAAKRIQPLTSAGFRLGAIVGGLTLSVLAAWVPSWTIILIWLTVSAGIAVLIWTMPPLRVEKKTGMGLTGTIGSEAAKRSSFVSNMKEGYGQVRQSSFMIWMAISTFLVMMLIALLEYASSGLLLQSFKTSGELAGYLGLLNALGNLFALPVLLFLTSRLIARLGLGNANLIFPIGNALATGGLILFPGIVSASFVYFDRTAFRSTFYSPINSLLYNAMPLRVRGRARAFVNGLIVPVGSLIGALLLMIPYIANQQLVLWVLAGDLALGFALCAIVVRRLYGKALVQMLEQEDYSFLLTREAEEVTVVDPATLAQLQKKLEATTNHELVVFIAQLIIQVGGKQAIPILSTTVRNAAEPRTRAALLDLFVAADMNDNAVRHLYTDFLVDPDSRVRESAIAGLEQIAGSSDKEFAAQMQKLVTDPDLDVRLRSLSAMASMGSLYESEPAMAALEQILADENPRTRAEGVGVLGNINAKGPGTAERTVTKLLAFLKDSSDQVRLEAATGLEEICRERQGKFIFNEQLDKEILDTVAPLMSDPVERVRVAAVLILRRIDMREARQALLKGLGDSSTEVRSTAVNELAGMGRKAIPLIHPSLNAQDPQIRKMAAVVLAQINPREFSPLITETHITGNLIAVYQNYSLVESLAPCNQYSGIEILRSALREQNQQLNQETFYLLSAINSPDAIQVIYDSLRSSDDHTRANAAEALESLTSPQTARLIAPLFDQNISPATLSSLSKETWEMESPTTPQAVRQLAAAPTEAWVRAITMFALGQIGAAMPPPQPVVPVAPPESPATPVADSAAARRGGRFKAGDLFGAIGGNGDSEKKPANPPPPKESAAAAAPVPYISGLERAEIQALLEAGCADPNAEVHLAAVAAQRLMMSGKDKGLSAPGGQEEHMLSIIEKIIFLKQVPFFQGMTVAQLRVLANVCEEEFFGADTRIYNEGDPGGVLYVVVNGRVGIEQEKRKGSFARLANIDAYSYFGEMNLFDNSARSTSAVATQDTLTLRLRREPLIVLARQHPDLSLELINVLSQRLRDVSDRVADLTRTRPRELHKLYDAFDS